MAPGTSFSDFIGTAQGAGAQPIITVNYGTGTPALAAAWVQDADVTNNYGIQYWEVGNEVYGNGTYGANWETDSHCNTSLNGTPVTVAASRRRHGATDYGDQGIFSNNTDYGGTTEPAVDTPFAPYYGIEMLTKLGAAGDEMVEPDGVNPL